MNPRDDEMSKKSLYHFYIFLSLQAEVTLPSVILKMLLGPLDGERGLQLSEQLTDTHLNHIKIHNVVTSG